MATWLFVVLVGLWSSVALAHQTGASTFIANVHADTGVVETLVAFPGRDLADELGVDTNHDGQISADELAPRYGDLATYTDAHLGVEGPDGPCTVTERKAGPLTQALEAYWYLKAYTCPVPLTSVTFTNRVMFDAPGAYQHLGKVQLGDRIETTAFNTTFPTYRLDVAEPNTETWDVVKRYIVEGFKHILLGPDHVLFVFLLLLLAADPRRLAMVITSFTLAHSLTLGLAALAIVDVPAHVVEPVIALSIAFVAIETMWRRDTPKYLGLVTFAFGLVHGFGFSYVLRDNVGLPTNALIPALASFNIGVELGQLMMVLPVYPLRRWLSTQAFERRVVVALGGLALMLSLYWLVDRTVGLHV